MSVILGLSKQSTSTLKKKINQLLLIPQFLNAYNGFRGGNNATVNPSQAIPTNPCAIPDQLQRKTL